MPRRVHSQEVRRAYSQGQSIFRRFARASIELCGLHGYAGLLPLHSKGNLYNFHLTRAGAFERAPVEPNQHIVMNEPAHTSSSSAGTRQQAQMRERLHGLSRGTWKRERQHTSGQQSFLLATTKTTSWRSPRSSERWLWDVRPLSRSVHREWCEVCVAARGIGETSGGSRTERTHNLLRLLSHEYQRRISPWSNCSSGTSGQRSGSIWGGVLREVHQKTSFMKFINCSDNEPSMSAVKDAAARSLPPAKTVPELCPVGDHPANESIQVRVPELKRQMRAVRMPLEKRLGMRPAHDDPILAWVPTFLGDVISRYRRRAEGKTPWPREAGRRWPEKTQRINRPKQDWEPRLIKVRYADHHART